jgi:hypothetical protein
MDISEAPHVISWLIYYKRTGSSVKVTVFRDVTPCILVTHYSLSTFTIPLFFIRSFVYSFYNLVNTNELNI